MTLIEDTTKAWTALAEWFERLGQDAPAKLVRFLADDLLRRERVWSEELLTLDQAAAESGLSYSHLQHQLTDGTLPNAGRRGAPRIRRRDLARTNTPDPQPTTPTPVSRDRDLIDEVLAGFR